MKPTSLAIASPAGTAALKTGHQMNEPAGPPARENHITSIPTPKVPANAITNQGMICTKRMVFNVPRFADLEVSPIHIPNQYNASRLPRVARPVTIPTRLDRVNSPRVLTVPTGDHPVVVRVLTTKVV